MCLIGKLTKEYFDLKTDLNGFPYRERMSVLFYNVIKCKCNGKFVYLYIHVISIAMVDGSLEWCS